MGLRFFAALFWMVCLGGCTWHNNARAQSYYLEGWLSTDRTAWRIDRYNRAGRYFSGGLRLAAGTEHLQIGVAWGTDLTHPEFVIVNSTGTSGTRESFDSQWWVVFTRLNFSSLPARRFGFVLHMGLGRQQTLWTIWREPEGQLLAHTQLDQGLMWQAGFGLSVPLYKWLHMELRYEYAQVRRQPTNLPVVGAYTAGGHRLSTGLSLNFAGKKARGRCSALYQ